MPDSVDKDMDYHPIAAGLPGAVGVVFAWDGIAEPFGTAQVEA